MQGEGSSGVMIDSFTMLTVVHEQNIQVAVP